MKSTTFITAGATGLSAVAFELLGLSTASAEPSTPNRALAAVSIGAGTRLNHLLPNPL